MFKNDLSEMDLLFEEEKNLPLDGIFPKKSRVCVWEKRGFSENLYYSGG